MRYTPSQVEAIGHRAGNLLIIACAGSGKTEVISRRIARLVDEGVSRSEIVAFTFMERAAAELKARIRQHLEELRPEDPSLGDMYVGTIHSFCLRMLKEIDPSYRNYEVMDEARQAALMVSNFYGDHGLGLQRFEERIGRDSWYSEVIRRFINTLNAVHIEGLSIDDLDDPVLEDALQKYFEMTQGAPNFFFDFDAIIGEALDRLHSDPASLGRLRDKFRYLIVDEYQDIDARQEELIQLLSRGGEAMSVTAVGDDDQAIFGWRGARIENILNFERRYPDVTRIDMEDNFRSTHAIAEIANRAIARLPPGRRLEKAMVARRWDESTAPPRLIERTAQDGDIQRRTFPSEADEAEWVADRIEALLGVEFDEGDGTTRPLHYSDMAILLRSVKGAAQDFVHELSGRNIPFVVKGTRGLFSAPEIQLVNAVFCQLARQPFYFTRLDGSTRRLSVDDTRNFIRDQIDDMNRSAHLPGADATSLLEWIAEKRERLARQELPRERRGRLSRRIYPQSLFHELLAVLGAGDPGNDWPEQVLYNLGRFSTLLTQFEGVHQWITPSDLGSLNVYLGVWARHHADPGGLDEGAGPPAVQILTVHAAKGLEWPVVFLPRISSYVFPSSMRNRGRRTFLSDDVFDASRYASGDEGERRLWYVGLTRCMKFLHISSLDRKRARPTDYFTEITHDYVRDDGLDPTPREYGDPTPARDTELLPTTFSDLNYYWQCPADYELRNLMGFGPGVREQYGYGQQIHNILAEVHERAKAGEEVDEQAIGELVDERFNLRYTSGPPFEALRRAARQSLVRYVQDYHEHVHLVLEAEKPFEYVDRDSGALISGTIDLLERVENEGTPEEERVPVCVVDFKAHKWESIEAYERRIEEVERQLRLYAAAARHALSMDPRGAEVHFLSPHPPSQELLDEGVRERVTFDVTPERQEEARGEVAEAVRGIREGEFPRRGVEDGRCPRCDFRLLCSGYAEYQEVSGADGPLPPGDLEVLELERVMEEQGVGWDVPDE